VKTITRLNLDHTIYKDIKHLAGVDEVGRGCLCGPVVAAAVILGKNFKLSGINDSKKISEKQREILAPQIKNSVLAYGIGIVDHKMIDDINILNASLLAMKLAVKQLKIVPNLVLVDGNKLIPNLIFPQACIVKGDSKSQSIAAASIIAKVTRDHIMLKQHKLFPTYHFKSNKGYGTKAHYTALQKYGPLGIHRRSFNLKLNEQVVLQKK
jgi:ribonuclease HII